VQYLAPKNVRLPWTDEEDRLLVDKINEMGMRWAVIMRSFNGRSEVDLRNRWHSHLKSHAVHDGTRFVYMESDSNWSEEMRRGQPMAVVPGQMPPVALTNCRPFGSEEDALLLTARRMNPSELWTDTAKRFPGRTAAQCYNRYLWCVALAIGTRPWTPEEDQLLVDRINEMGWTWEAISASFDGRSEDEIKNRWNSHLQFKTVHNGTKLTFTATVSNCPNLPDRSDTTAPEIQVPSVLTGGLEPEDSNAFLMNSTGMSMFDPFQYAENETTNDWEGTMTGRSTEEGFSFNPRELY
jgi:hypothetical protein